MRHNFILAAGCIILLLFSGCVSKSRFIDISDDFQRTRQQLLNSEQKIAELNQSLEASQKETDRCRQTNNRLQDEIEKNNAEIHSSTQQIESLSQTIEKQAAVISLQNTVIRLFDDSEQTLQKSLREQMEIHNLEPAGSSPPVK